MSFESSHGNGDNSRSDSKFDVEVDDMLEVDEGITNRVDGVVV